MIYDFTGEASPLGAPNPEPNDHGIYENSNGGTERMFRGLMDRLPEDLKDEFHIICSRVRKVHPAKKNVLWLHDTFDDPESQHLKDPKSRERFAHLVFVSQYQFQTYNMALGVPYLGSVVMNNAIDPIEDHVKPDPKDGVRFIYHTTPHRGLDLLIPVFEEVAKEHPNVHLDVFSSFSLYGWPQRDQEYEEVFEKCRNHPNITYHGAQPNHVVREALKKAHVFAYPNVWPETSCIAAIEAMSAGCVVVTPDYGALPETTYPFSFQYRWTESIQDHVNRFGYMVMRIIENYGKSTVISSTIQNQKTFVNQRFSWDTRAREWNGFLRAL